MVTVCLSLGLPTECRRDSVNVDQDVASHGWTNWEAKKEPISKFVHLEPNHLFIDLDLDSPSPPQKKRKSTSELLVPASTTSSMPSRPVMNPTHLDLGLSAVEEEDDLEEALAREMDLLAEDSAFPDVGGLGVQCNPNSSNGCLRTLCCRSISATLSV